MQVERAGGSAAASGCRRAIGLGLGLGFTDPAFANCSGLAVWLRQPLPCHISPPCTAYGIRRTASLNLMIFLFANSSLLTNSCLVRVWVRGGAAGGQWG